MIFNTLICHLYSQQTLLLVLNTLARMLNYASAPLRCNLCHSPPNVLSRLLKLTNFHGNKVQLQWDHNASFHSVMVPTQIPAWDCCYFNPDKLAGTQSVQNRNTVRQKESIHLHKHIDNMQIYLKRIKQRWNISYYLVKLVEWMICRINK